MNAEFTPKKPEPVLDENIVLNGSTIGWVKEYENSATKKQFHCGLNVDVNDMIPALIQGFGNSREEAIEHALKKGAAYAESLANGIAVLCAELDGVTK